MAKAKVKTRKETLKSGVKTLNKGIITTSGTVFNISKELGEKWNAFLKKAIKQTEPLTEKQIDLAFDVAEKAKLQVAVGKERFESLVKLDQPIVKTLTENLSPKKVANKVTDTVSKIGAYVSKAEKEGEELTSKVKKKAKKAAKKSAKKIKASKELTEDIVEEAIDKVQDVVNATKAMVAPETSSPKTAKKTAKKATKATAKKTTKAKKSVKASAKKTTKKASKTAKKVVTTVKTSTKADDLTIIVGVGPKTVERLNEMGIYSFEAIQKLTNKELDAVIKTLGARFKTAKAADWKKQIVAVAKK